jgi:alpha-tubulin suppressor-like RCC1 family protein
VFVWGQNKEHQLGIETPPDILNKPNMSQKTEPLPKLLNVPKIKKAAAGYKHTLFVDMQGREYVGVIGRQPVGLREESV